MKDSVKTSTRKTTRAIIMVIALAKFTFAVAVASHLVSTRRAHAQHSKPVAQAPAKPLAQSELPEGMDKKEEVMGPADGAIKTAKVFFISPKDGETVTKKFKVKMGVEGMKIRAAGEAPDEVISGHHHLIIDGGFVPAGQVIIDDKNHLHFGKGQTETEVTLTPGEHTLTLQFADGAHRSFGEKLSATIKIKVR